jgi:5-methylcytosine-specific restriction endonuclease McrA
MKPTASFASIGNYGGVWIAEGYFNDQNRADPIVVCYLVHGDEFPKNLEQTFKNYFSRGNATCIECSHPMEELSVQGSAAFKYIKELKARFPKFNPLRTQPSAFVVCRCGRSIWRLRKPLDIGAIVRADRSRRRAQSLKNVGGVHTSGEIRDIVRLQKGRCIYCNKKFTGRLPPTGDHLFAVVDGGSNWGLNIMMACRSCNSRRCDIPFRTYCKLLSPMQNRRILSHLRSRLLELDFDSLSVEEQLSSFNAGLDLHDPLHKRYRMIQTDFIAARKNAARNKLLPRTATGLFRSKWAWPHEPSGPSSCWADSRACFQSPLASHRRTSGTPSRRTEPVATFDQFH